MYFDFQSRVTIPASVADIDTDAFRKSGNLVIRCEPETAALQYAIDNEIPYEYGGVCGDNLVWTVAGSVLSISGTGDMYDYGWRNKEGTDKWYPETPWINENLQSFVPISTIVLPEGITSIGNNAFIFYGPTFPSPVTIPATVTRLGINALSSFSYDEFYVSSAITSINCGINCANFAVDSGNTAFSAVDGVLYSYDKQTLVCYPSQNQRECFEIPSTVITIGDNAFTSFSYLHSLIIPASVQSINLNFIADDLQSITVQGMNTIIADPQNFSFYRTTPLAVTFYPYSTAQAYVEQLSQKIEVISEYIPFDSTLTLPASTQKIESEAFADLSGYFNVVIPSTVTEIEDDAFNNSKILLLVINGSEGEDYAVRNSIPFLIQ